ncbi:hypothetical protein EVAR_25370_1 [Eumeta japonica]|uniref:Uncharacterized protein n=1 Tax=Eumeta variegata TaxID=151549 RepID=A0A4C1XXW5_EUMVA|nr:hypothetical protein EVAR_25370_1 [Eumeta japonica]
MLTESPRDKQKPKLCVRYDPRIISFASLAFVIHKQGSFFQQYDLRSQKRSLAAESICRASRRDELLSSPAKRHKLIFEPESRDDVAARVTPPRISYTRVIRGKRITATKHKSTDNHELNVVASYGLLPAGLTTCLRDPVPSSVIGGQGLIVHRGTKRGESCPAADVRWLMDEYSPVVMSLDVELVKAIAARSRGLSITDPRGLTSKTTFRWRGPHVVYASPFLGLQSSGAAKSSTHRELRVKPDFEFYLIPRVTETIKSVLIGALHDRKLETNNKTSSKHIRPIKNFPTASPHHLRVRIAEPTQNLVHSPIRKLDQVRISRFTAHKTRPPRAMIRQ